MREFKSLIVGGLTSFVLLMILSVEIRGDFKTFAEAASRHAVPVGLLTCAWIATALGARGSFGRMMLGLMTGAAVFLALNLVEGRVNFVTGLMAASLTVAALPVADACGDDVSRAVRFIRIMATTAILWPFASFLSAGRAYPVEMLISWAWPLPFAVAWLFVPPPTPRGDRDPHGEV